MKLAHTPSPRTASAVAAVIALTAATAAAHVELDAPNGGEVLEAGTVFTIMWTETISHSPTNWDLWYSTTGPGGPWIVIAEDLTPPPVSPNLSYDWTVPDDPSTTVRVRVRQDNEGADYEDVSESDLTIVSGSGPGSSATLEPVRDATLYEGDGSLANGSGSYLFAGATEAQNGSLERRGLLAFDIRAAIPPGATITEVELGLTMSRTTSGAQTVELRRVLNSWGEGPSDPPGQEGGGAAAVSGDATWLHRTYPSDMWSTPGGEIETSASGSVPVGGTGPVTFASTPELVADVQAWLDSPSTNYGWALVVPSPPTGSAKRFNSREHGTASTRPQLRVTYEGGSAPPNHWVFIPAAARAAGAAGSFFVTTADVFNPRTHDAAFRLIWLPRNTDNSDPLESETMFLGPGETLRFDDLLLDGLGLDEGVGAVAVLTDTEGLEVMSRTYNLADDGSFGQGLAGVPEDELIPAGTRALILFLTENDDLRSNLGLVNGTTDPITVRWDLYAGDGTMLESGSAELPPWGNRQLNQVLEDHAPVEAAYAQVWTTTVGAAFTCYGSVLDNRTSDPTTVPPR